MSRQPLPLPLLATFLIASSVAVAASAQPAESVCARGLAAEQAGTELARAHFWLESCLAGSPDDSDRVSAKKALRRLTGALRQGDFAEVAFISEPGGATLAIASLQLRFEAPRTLWLPYGRYLVASELAGHDVISQPIQIDSKNRVTFLARLSERRDPKTGDGSVDFAADPPPAATTTRKQQAEEFDSLLPDRFGDGATTTDGRDQASSSRWPLWVTAAGVAIVGAGVAFHLRDQTKVAVGLYGGGAAMIGLGVTGLVLTRARRSDPSSPGPVLVGWATTW